MISKLYKLGNHVNLHTCFRHDFIVPTVKSIAVLIPAENLQKIPINKDKFFVRWYPRLNNKYIENIYECHVPWNARICCVHSYVPFTSVVLNHSLGRN